MFTEQPEILGRFRYWENREISTSSGWHIWANPEWRMIFPKQVENDGNAAPHRNRKQ